MGICGSSGELSEQQKAEVLIEKKRSRELEKDLTKQYNADNQVNKLLLLGAGESGKSTLFKQMISIYGKGFPDEDRKSFIGIIHNNIITACKVLVVQSDVLTGKGATAVETESGKAAKEFLNEIKQDAKLDDTCAFHIKNLWADPGIKMTYELRSNFQLTDSTDYWMHKIDEVARSDYIPTEQDVLRCRVRTTGIVENEFIIEGNKFKMFDVGGQRNERKKWIHCFSEVTAVLFVAALSEYDMCLYEDEQTNRMDEAITLFDEICNSRWFSKTCMILMLNKSDLFREKVKKVPLTVCFPDYVFEYPKNQASVPIPPGETYEDAARFEHGKDFIKKQFENKQKSSSKPIYTHITCATDKATTAHVFNAVKDIVIRRSLQEGGLLNP